MTPKRIQTAITLLRANGYRVHKIGAPAIRPRIEGCDAACTEAKHTRACLARKYRRKRHDECLDPECEICGEDRRYCLCPDPDYMCPPNISVDDGSPLADKIAANQMLDE